MKTLIFLLASLTLSTCTVKSMNTERQSAFEALQEKIKKDREESELRMQAFKAGKPNSTQAFNYAQEEIKRLKEQQEASNKAIEEWRKKSQQDNEALEQQFEKALRDAQAGAALRIARTIKK